jgi:general secretion pathway protein K
VVVRKSRKLKPETYFGFPVIGDVEADEEVLKKDSGVALIIAIMIIATVVIFTSDMIVNSSVSLQLATANRDNVKAEYEAKSGLNLATFLISADWGIDLFQYQVQNKQPSDGSSDIWSMLNGLPIGSESLEMAKSMTEQFDLSAVNDSDVIDQLGMFDGSFTINVTDERSKINLNFCSEGQAKECMEMIEAIMSCPAEKAFLEKKKVNPRELAANIRDWVDTNMRSDSGSKFPTENDAYSDRNPKISPKNAPFDSVDELKLVEGWDDDLHTIFAPFFTVYPKQPVGQQAKPKVNLNSAARELLVCLLPESNTRCAEKSALFMNPGEDEDAPEVLSDAGGIKKRLEDVFCESNKEKQEWFSYYTDTFRIVSAGNVGDQRVVLDVVMQRRMPDDIDKSAQFKGTYKYLYWKMM